MRLSQLAAISVMFISTTVQAGPFGFSQGETVEALSKKIKLKPTDSKYSFTAVTVPSPHADFDDYRLIITPQHGLCKIIAWTPETKMNSFGNEAVSKFNNLENALSSKYGTGKRYDFLQSGSIWRESADWSMSLLKKERSLVTFWDVETSKTMPDDMESVTLETVGASRDSFMINLTYGFPNEGKCVQWIKEQKNSVL